jgi:hypothetical protein
MSDASSNERGKASFELDLGRIGFVVIIPVMLWVYTTFSGLVDIMRKGPDDNFGLIGAVIGAAAILSLMALSSWLLGSELAAAVAGRRRAAKGGIAGLFIIVLAFVFFFGMSAFFSYTYYHANLFNLSARKLTGETQRRIRTRSGREKRCCVSPSPGATRSARSMTPMLTRCRLKSR